jgi:hypothetical protein
MDRIPGQIEIEFAELHADQSDLADDSDILLPIVGRFRLTAMGREVARREVDVYVANTGIRTSSGLSAKMLTDPYGLWCPMRSSIALR